jgi:hypothetical protein
VPSKFSDNYKIKKSYNLLLPRGMIRLLGQSRCKWTVQLECKVKKGIGKCRLTRNCIRKSHERYKGRVEKWILARWLVK